MTRWTRRLSTHTASVSWCFFVTPAIGTAQQAPPTSIVIVTGQDASMPIPTLMEGPYAAQENQEVADQLFLRLAALGPDLITAGDRGFLPQLARSWTRRDSVTVAFQLDPRARWHDGMPVTARDVLFTFGRARNSTIAPRSAQLLRRVASVIAEGVHTVVFRFTEPYGEQVYDAVFHVAPIPAHLLDTVPAADLIRSRFVQRPVGSGPYKWVRHLPGDLIELHANPSFFLGKPGIDRLIIRAAADADARLNMLLSGEADAMDNVPPPPSNQKRVSDRKDLRLLSVPSNLISFLLYNQRDPRDTTRPHPILTDVALRRALTLALDRRMIVQAVLGRFGEVPFGPVSPVLWIRHGAPAPAAPNQAAAQRLLASRGWIDGDGDGIREKGGKPLILRLSFPATSATRQSMALLIQEQWRHIGVGTEIASTDRAVYNELRNRGGFDVDFSGVLQDPTPSGLTQGWSCGGGTNVAKYCDPVVDSLLERAIAAGVDSKAWHAVLRRVEEDAPATFLYALNYAYALHRRYDNVTIRPDSPWSAVWRWTVRPVGSAQGARN